MGIKVDFIKENGKIIKLEIGGNGFIDRKKFKELLETVKTLDDRKYDPILSTWIVPLNMNNFKIIESILSEEQRKKLEQEL